MEITPRLIDKLADLAQLELDEAARNEMINDLKEIIAFFEKLQEVNTEGIEPLMHITEGENRLRNDEVNLQITKAEALENAPLQDGNYFMVPKVIKK